MPASLSYFEIRELSLISKLQLTAFSRDTVYNAPRVDRRAHSACTIDPRGSHGELYGTIIDRFMRRLIDPRVNPIFGGAAGREERRGRERRGRRVARIPSTGHRKDRGKARGKKLLRTQLPSSSFVFVRSRARASIQT